MVRFYVGRQLSQLLARLAVASLCGSFRGINRVAVQVIQVFPEAACLPMAAM
jgi:hypothetical protein